MFAGVKVSASEGTEQVDCYSVSEYITFLDFPGSNAIEEFGRLFGQMGHVNSISVFIVQYEGKIDQTVVT